jgi:hypothetical protein
MFGKLYIYDGSTEEDRSQAAGRFSSSDYVRSFGVDSKSALLFVLERLAMEKTYFSRLLVQTHGGPGHISINGRSIWDNTIKSDFSGKNLDALFPLYTRIYFDGCNVAEGSSGIAFLEAVGSVFLRRGGGEVFGWTSYGYGMAGWIPFIGGHTVHFSGQLRRLHFRPGGIRYTPPVPKSPFGDDRRMERGFKV